jgi:transcriptional regulator with GAF, ATPase, and Fis domain
VSDLSGTFQRSLTPAGIVLSRRRFPSISWSDAAGKHDAFVQKRMVVGAAAAADLVIDDPTVSRIHAELEPKADGLVIRDLSSRNGTMVNGVSARETILRADGEVRLGTTVIAVDYANAVVAPVELWPNDAFHYMVGRSPVMKELFALLARVARTDASILITGETGTGKEVVARSVHEASTRSKGPFVVVDCAALPENLLDAELFGHSKGAFTGAVQARAGAIESADGGTVFIDEVGELPLTMQPKLLRVLEQRTVRRVGEAFHRPVNVRFVTATHRDLLSMVSRGEFREDLYFRMCVLPVKIPPLRERPEDIELLVSHFLKGERLSPEFIAELSKLPWRGNVRELRNFVERARALGEDKVAQIQTRSTTTNAFGDEEVPTSHAMPRTRATLPPPSSRAIPSLVDPADDDIGGTTPIDVLAELRASIGVHPTDLGQPPEAAPSASTPLPTATASLEYGGSFKTFRERWIEIGEREYLKQMLAKHDRNVGAVTTEAGVDRTYIYRMMRKHGL